eukprot:gene16409-biopygen15821
MRRGRTLFPPDSFFTEGPCGTPAPRRGVHGAQPLCGSCDNSTFPTPLSASHEWCVQDPVGEHADLACRSEATPDHLKLEPVRGGGGMG